MIALTHTEAAALPRWVGWLPVVRKGRATKAPFAANGAGNAKADDPATWADRASADVWAREHVNGAGGGIGLQLGPVPERPGAALGGVDLDACRDPTDGALSPWAADLVARLGSYAEVSPSGTGVKVYFTYSTGDLAALRAVMGTEHGRSFKRGRGEHPEAIELHVSNRYFAWTGQHLEGTPADLRPVPLETLFWLIRTAGPGFAAGGRVQRPSGPDRGPASWKNAPIVRLQAAVDGDAGLARRWSGDTAGLKDGSRSGLAFTLGAALKRHGFDFAEMCDLLRRNPHTADWAATKGEADGARELRRVWERAGATATDEPEPPPAPDLRVLRLHRRAPPALPLAVFGAEWMGWIKDAAEAAATSPDYVAAPLLAAASATIGNARWAQAYPGWQEPPHLWMCSVGESGGGKSPGADPILKGVLPRIEEAMCRDFPEKRREWEAAAAAAKAQRDAWQADVAKAAKNGGALPLPPADADGPPEPQPPCLRLDDTSIERIALLLAGGSPKGLLMVRDELAGHLLGMNTYNDGARAFWIEAYGGRPYRVHRVKLNTPIAVPHLAVSWWGGTQPGKLAELMRGADDGLLARFCWVWPEPVPFDLPRAAPDLPFAAAAFDKLRLLEMRDTEAGPAPLAVPLAEDARADLLDFARDMQERQSWAGGLMNSALGKARGLALRLSLVLEYLWWSGRCGMAPPPAVISREAFAAAATLVADYLLPMAERTYGDAAAPERDRNAATLARWVAKERPVEVHVRALQRDVRLPGLATADAIHGAAAVLVDAGWLVPPAGGGGQTGRPKAAYPINAALWGALAP